MLLGLPGMPMFSKQLVGVEIRSYIKDEDRITVKQVSIHHGYLLNLSHLEYQPIRYRESVLCQVLYDQIRESPPQDPDKIIIGNEEREVSFAFLPYITKYTSRINPFNIKDFELSS